MKLFTWKILELLMQRKPLRDSGTTFLRTLAIFAEPERSGSKDLRGALGLEIQSVQGDLAV